MDYQKVTDTEGILLMVIIENNYACTVLVCRRVPRHHGGNSQMFPCEKVHQGQRRSRKLIFEDNFLMNFQLRLSFRGPGLLGSLKSSWKGPNGVQLWAQREHLPRTASAGETPGLRGFLWALWVPVACCIDLAFSGFIAILNM